MAPTFLIYILCYDDASQKKAIKRFGNQPWARILFIASTPYLESIAYLHYLPALRHEWEHVDYVGTLSYKAPEKIKIPTTAQLEKHVQNSYPDVIPFFPRPGTVLLEQGSKHHPLFVPLWIRLLLQLNVPPHLATAREVPVFFCNYWVATPTWMKRYIAFAQRAKHVMDTDPNMQADLWSDAEYASNNLSMERLLKVFQRPYYTHHPFVLERLPCMFFWLTNAFVHPIKN